MIFKHGQTIQFTYRPRVVDSDTGDPRKEIFVLHPFWQGKVHGIDLGRLDPAERSVLEAIMDPETKKHPHRIPLVNDIVRRMDVLTEIRNPVGFYTKFVKPFLRGKDAYRTYYQPQMSGIRVLESPAPPQAAKPLFGNRPAQGKQPEETPSPQERREMIRQAASKLRPK
jgi:hypothetical protein